MVEERIQLDLVFGDFGDSQNDIADRGVHDLLKFIFSKQSVQQKAFPRLERASKIHGYCPENYTANRPTPNPALNPV